MTQPHPRDRACDTRGLERVVPRRLARLHVAEAAASRARVAEDHECCGAALPALADIRTRSLLADGVQALCADHLGELSVAGAASRRPLEPGCLAPARRAPLLAEDLEDVHSAGVRP